MYAGDTLVFVYMATHLCFAIALFFFLGVVNKLNYPGPNCVTFTEIIEVFSDEHIFIARKGTWVF